MAEIRLFERIHACVALLQYQSEIRKGHILISRKQQLVDQLNRQVWRPLSSRGFASVREMHYLLLLSLLFQDKRCHIDFQKVLLAIPAHALENTTRRKAFMEKTIPVHLTGQFECSSTVYPECRYCNLCFF